MSAETHEFDVLDAMRDRAQALLAAKFGEDIPVRAEGKDDLTASIEEQIARGTGLLVAVLNPAITEVEAAETDTPILVISMTVQITAPMARADSASVSGLGLRVLRTLHRKEYLSSGQIRPFSLGGIRPNWKAKTGAYSPEFESAGIACWAATFAAKIRMPAEEVAP